MALTGAVAMALALVAGSGEERVLLCRPRILGDPALARGEAVPEAARAAEGRFLDYGVACEDGAEGARAARRAGLAHAVTGTAEGLTGGSRYVLTLSAAEGEANVASRRVEVPPGADAVRPVRSALAELLATVPPAETQRTCVGAWSLVGAGAAAIAGGIALALSAQSAADDANAATTPEGYTAARASWQSRRTWSAVALGAGAAAVGGGLVWRFAF
jgi:hypothetical protein